MTFSTYSQALDYITSVFPNASIVGSEIFVSGRRVGHIFQRTAMLRGKVWIVQI